MKEVEVPSGPVPPSDEVVEAVRIAIRDKWQDGCARVCVVEGDFRQFSCSCKAIAEVMAPAAIEAYQKATQEGVAAGLPAQVQDGETKAAAWLAYNSLHNLSGNVLFDQYTADQISAICEEACKHLRSLLGGQP